MNDSLLPRLELHGAHLTVSGELGQETEAEFEEALRSLTTRGAGTCLVDMAGVTYVSSGYVRLLAMAMIQARAAGRTFVIRATSRVARILQLGGIDQLGDVELISGD